MPKTQVDTMVLYSAAVGPIRYRSCKFDLHIVVRQRPLQDTYSIKQDTREKTQSEWHLAMIMGI